jgi:hypothetical protein
VRVFLALLAVLLSLGLGAPAARADGLLMPREPPPGGAPAGFKVDASEAVDIANGTGAVRREAGRQASQPLVAHPFVFGDQYWLVRYFRGSQERVQAQLNGRTGRVVGAWSGAELAWPPIAHGQHGPRARRLHKLMVIAALLFLLPFIDPRRPFRLLHLDLLAILAIGISYGFAARGNIYVSTPLVYPPLVYLLCRLVVVAVRGSPPVGRLTWMSPGMLALGLVAVLALRYAYVAIDGSVSDVGFASLVGADSIIHGYPIYDSSAGNSHLDSYGAINYLAYTPFALASGFNLTHSHAGGALAAGMTFDFLTVGALFVLGRRLWPGRDGLRLGLALAWAYAACPWTLFALAFGTNDALVAMLLAWTLVVAGSQWGRGIALALASATKFAPLALAGLWLRVGHERGRRPMLVYASAFAATLVLVFVAYLPDGGFRELYDRTLGFQFARTSPFSIWGLHPGLAPVRTAVTVLAAGLAVVAVVVPRERDLVRLAAFGAALLIAAQLTAINWYYFYIPWFLPYALAGLLRPAPR